MARTESAGSILRKFAQAGGDPTTARDNKGWTALHLVCHLPFVGSEQCVDWLLRHNADVSAVSSDGLTPIHLAAADGQVATTQKLLLHRASPNGSANDGTTPLHLAARAGNQAVVNLLLEKMADVGQACALGNTALHDAASNGHAKCVRVLLDFGAEPSVRNKAGANAPDLAAQAHHPEVMQVLQAWREAKRVAQQRAGDGVTGGDKRGARPQEVATSSRADFARQLRESLVLDNGGAATRGQHNAAAQGVRGGSKKGTLHMQPMHMSPMGGLMGESDRLDMGFEPSPAARLHPAAIPAAVQHEHDTPSPHISPPPRANPGAVRPAPGRVGGAGIANGQNTKGNKLMMGDATATLQEHQPSAQHQEQGVHQAMQAQRHHAQYVTDAQSRGYPLPLQEQQQVHFPLQGPQYVPQGAMLLGQAVGPAAAHAPYDQVQVAQGQAPRAAHAETDMDWEIDSGDLVFGKMLGSGTFGDVYKGKWLGSDVAIKVLRVTRALDDTQIREFRAEVDIMACMRHVNIVQFVGACTKPPQLAIVTEYLPKMSLYDVMRTEPLLWPRMLHIAGQGAAGILYLHHRKPPIVHRDIKSDNFLIDSNYNVKVCDFGLARFRRNETHVATSHNRAGTPGWMAPEVLRGEKFDETSDLYSFGVVLWEMLTLEQPWKEVDPIQLPGIVGFQGRRLRLPAVAPPGCPLDYISLIADCWHHHPQRRPKMREVVERLSRMSAVSERADSALV